MPSFTAQSAAPFPDGLPLADIYTVDCDKLRAGDGVDERKVYDASRGYGFFYLTNTHVDYDFMFDVADETFSLPLDTKMKYEMGNTGSYFGYKMSGSNYVDSKGTPDKAEFYNVSKDDVMRIGRYNEKPLQHPDTIVRRRSELETFMASCHEVTLVILRVLERQLGLDADALLNIHKLHEPSADQARVTFAPPVGSGEIIFGEHSDFGSITVLFNQLGGLQVINPESYEWKYVKPKPGAAIINLGDSLIKLLGGRLYSAVHRIMGPPGPQAQYPRHSVVYFSRPNSGVPLQSLFPGDPKEEKPMTADEWVAQRAKLRRTANYQDADSFKASRGTEHLNGRLEATLDGMLTNGR